MSPFPAWGGILYRCLINHPELPSSKRLPDKAKKTKIPQDQDQFFSACALLGEAGEAVEVGEFAVRQHLGQRGGKVEGAHGL
jgi:hypothetical protein